MDYQNYEYYKPNRRNVAFETASLVLGILSISTCLCIYVSAVCGALAAIFAILSKGGEDKMSTRALVGFWLGLSGLVCTVLLTSFAFLVSYIRYGSIEGILRASCEQYGYDYDALFGQTY